jgi:hypothetical protein
MSYVDLVVTRPKEARSARYALKRVYVEELKKIVHPDSDGFRGIYSVARKSKMTET